MSVRILVIGQLSPPVHGSNIMTEIFMRSLQNIGHHVSIVEKTFSQEVKDVGKFSITKLLRVPLISLKIIHQVVFNKPDLCFYFISVKLPSFLVDALFLGLIRLLGVNYVLYSHGKGLLDLGTNSARLVRLVVRKTLSGSAGALVLGERLKHDLNKFIPDRRLFLLPNAIPDIGREDIQLSRKDKGPVQILFLSNLRPSKGTLEYLQMAQKVVEQCKEVRFILAGSCRSDFFFHQINDVIKREGLIDFVEMPGAIYGPEKDRFFRESDIFVFPSHRDASPLVILEAMQRGLPVISSNQGAIPEVVQDGVSGYIIDPRNIDLLANSVLKLVKNRELSKNMGEAGRRLYEEFFTIQAYEKRLDQAVDFLNTKNDRGACRKCRG